MNDQMVPDMRCSDVLSVGGCAVIPKASIVTGVRSMESKRTVFLSRKLVLIIMCARTASRRLPGRILFSDTLPYRDVWYSKPLGLKQFLQLKRQWWPHSLNAMKLTLVMAITKQTWEVAEREDETVEKDESLEAMARLVQWHEEDLRNPHSDVNVGHAQREDMKLQQALEERIDKYNLEGEAARDKAKNDFKGHPWGMYPDELKKMVAIAPGPDPEFTIMKVTTNFEWGYKIPDCDTIATKDTEGNEVMKWIIEMPMDGGGVQGAGLQLECDTALSSQAAQEVEKLAIHEGQGTKGRGRVGNQKK